jgi:hypothetical protein
MSKRRPPTQAQIRQAARHSSIAQLPKLLPPLYKKKVSGVTGTKGSFHKQKMDRLLMMQGLTDQGITVRRREEKWMAVVLLSARIEMLVAGRFKVHREIKINAAKRIKLQWKMYKFRSIVHIIAFITVRSSVGWRLKLWVRIARKSLAQKKLVDFLRSCFAAR